MRHSDVIERNINAVGVVRPDASEGREYMSVKMNNQDFKRIENPRVQIFGCGGDRDGSATDRRSDGHRKHQVWGMVLLNEMESDGMCGSEIEV